MPAVKLPSDAPPTDRCAQRTEPEALGQPHRAGEQSASADGSIGGRFGAALARPRAPGQRRAQRQQRRVHPLLLGGGPRPDVDVQLRLRPAPCSMSCPRGPTVGVTVVPTSGRLSAATARIRWASSTRRVDALLRLAAGVRRPAGDRTTGSRRCPCARSSARRRARRPRAPARPSSRGPRSSISAAGRGRADLLVAGDEAGDAVEVDAASASAGQRVESPCTRPAFMSTVPGTADHLVGLSTRAAVPECRSARRCRGGPAAAPGSGRRRTASTGGCSRRSRFARARRPSRSVPSSGNQVGAAPHRGEVG